MKKKQKQKLLNQFRLSFENTRQQLFRTLEEKAHELYDLEIGVRLNPKNTELFDFELSPEDMAVIDGLDGVVGKAKNPDTTTF